MQMPCYHSLHDKPVTHMGLSSSSSSPLISATLMYITGNMKAKSDQVTRAGLNRCTMCAWYSYSDAVYVPSY
jgi:hypothetical protein